MKLRVTNDTAERGVKLIQDYAQTVKSDEAQRQALLQVVEHHRQNYLGFDKAALKKLCK